MEQPSPPLRHYGAKQRSGSGIMRVQSFCRMGTASRARDASSGSDYLSSVRDAFRRFIDSGVKRTIEVTGELGMLGESLN